MNDDTRLAQLTENMRFYGDMRFKQLTLFMAAMTVATGRIIDHPAHRWWIALAALFITSVMWIMETRSTLYALALHNEIGDAFWPRPQVKLFRWLGSSFAVLMLHASFYSFWLGCIRGWCPTCCVSFFVGLIVGIGLLSYSVFNYWDVKKFWVG
jgi:hypothetical protein